MSCGQPLQSSWCAACICRAASLLPPGSKHLRAGEQQARQQQLIECSLSQP